MRNKTYLYQNKKMEIGNKTVVSVIYSLSAKNEKQPEEKSVEKTSKEHPFVFLFGMGHLLEDFEKNLKGKKKGDAFDFRIDAAKGYGLRNEKYVISIPVDSFKRADGTVDLHELKIGNVLPMTDNQGNHLHGKIIEVTASTVQMDFNHELAGFDLHFTGEVLDVRTATAEEISHGHVHGPGEHPH
jgi:FKBP-type peptidyl-prolyl cis-trans isomerase SlyD